jgi:hypothetical protein
MIKLEGVTKIFDNGHVAVDHVNIEIKEGEFVVVIGSSGCGKTTMMKMINRLIEPTEGRILIEDKDISTEDPFELRRRIGYVIQEIGLFPHMNIMENIALVPRLKKWPKEKKMSRVAELLEMVGLDAAGFIIILNFFRSGAGSSGNLCRRNSYPKKFLICGGIHIKAGGNAPDFFAPLTFFPVAVNGSDSPVIIGLILQFTTWFRSKGGNRLGFGNIRPLHQI